MGENSKRKLMLHSNVTSWALSSEKVREINVNYMGVIRVFLFTTIALIYYITNEPKRTLKSSTQKASIPQTLSDDDVFYRRKDVNDVILVSGAGHLEHKTSFPAKNNGKELTCV